MSGALWLHSSVPYAVHLRSRAAGLAYTASALAFNAAALVVLGHWAVALVDLALVTAALGVRSLLRTAAASHSDPPPATAG